MLLTWADRTTEATVLFTSSTPRFLKISSRWAWRMQATLVSPSLAENKNNARQREQTGENQKYMSLEAVHGQTRPTRCTTSNAYEKEQRCIRKRYFMC